MIGVTFGTLRSCTSFARSFARNEEMAMSGMNEFLGIRRAVALWENRIDIELGAVHGLGLSEFVVMHHLMEAPGGRLRRVDLARLVALTPSGVTRLLGPLERRRIVAREADGHDARATYAVLTPAGKSLTKESAATVAAIAERILGSLADRDRAAFAKLAATAL
jgi:DNA-binding MarR family transcriptional regulator